MQKNDAPRSPNGHLSAFNLVSRHCCRLKEPAAAAHDDALSLVSLPAVRRPRCAIQGRVHERFVPLHDCNRKYKNASSRCGVIVSPFSVYTFYGQFSISSLSARAGGSPGQLLRR